MEAKAIEKLAELAVAARPRILQCPGEPNDTYRLIDIDGTIGQLEVASPAPRDYVSHTLDDLIELVVILGVGKGNCMIFVGHEAVTVVLDEPGARRERLTFPLHKTQTYLTLAMLGKQRVWKGQKLFVSMLRVELAESLDPTTVATFKSIEFKKHADEGSQVSNSIQAVSSKVLMELANSGKPIPDELNLNVAVYDEFPNDRKNVRCIVETDIEEAAFCLIPAAGELARAWRETLWMIQKEICRKLEENCQDLSRIKVVCGEPQRR